MAMSETANAIFENERTGRQRSRSGHTGAVERCPSRLHNVIPATSRWIVTAITIVIAVNRLMGKETILTLGNCANATARRKGSAEKNQTSLPKG